MQNPAILSDTAEIFDKFIERASNRIYSKSIDCAKNKFALHNSIDYIHNLSLLGYPKRDFGNIKEPENKEPNYCHLDSLATGQLDIKKDLDVHKMRGILGCGYKK